MTTAIIDYLDYVSMLTEKSNKNNKFITDRILTEPIGAMTTTY